MPTSPLWRHGLPCTPDELIRQSIKRSSTTDHYQLHHRAQLPSEETGLEIEAIGAIVSTRYSSHVGQPPYFTSLADVKDASAIVVIMTGKTRSKIELSKLLKIAAHSTSHPVRFYCWRPASGSFSVASKLKGYLPHGMLKKIRRK